MRPTRPGGLVPLLRGILLRRRSLLAALILLLGSGGTLLGSGALRAVGAGGEPDWQMASDTVVVYGPKRFDAGKGRPALHVERFTVAATPGVRYTLRLVNGAADGSGRAAKATVSLNGASLFSAAEFQHGGILTLPLELRGENVLEITVEGSPGSYVTLSVLQTPDPTFPVFHPKKYVRRTAAPFVETDRFTISATAAAPYELHVLNGAPDGTLRVSSAVVRLNGREVLSPSDLNQQVGGLIREVPLQRDNVLEVEVRSAPDSYLTLWVTATDTTPPVLTITAPEPRLITRALEVEVAGTVQDETATRVTVNDSTAARSGEGFSATVPLTVEGENTLTVTATDAPGHRTDSVRVVIRDTEPPVITVSSPLDGALTRDSLVEVSGTIQDMTAVTMNVNGVPVPLDSAGAFRTVLPLVEGANFFTIAATDAAGNSASQTLQVTRDSKPPVITVAEPEEGATTQDSTVRVGGTVEDASPVTLTLNGADVPLSDGAFTASAALAVGSNALTLTATDAVGNTATATRTVTRESAGPPLPPDPTTVAPQLDRTVATQIGAATEFLYAGTDPIQTGVAPGTISPVRAAVIRGRVLDRELEPLPGVTVTVRDHPELGQTLSRADGAYDLAVNGGGVLTLDYQKAGYLPAQRQVNAPWQDYAHVEDVILLQPDSVVTRIDLTSSEVQVARGSVAEDVDGKRQATLLVEPGTTATLVMPDGSTQPASSLSVRLTEYTVGENGPQAMPGVLPPTSRYTYAVAITADEALAAGAAVRFSRPVPLYVENFLQFPVGTPVPVGVYDAQRGAWVAQDNGRVIRVLDTSGGIAQIDADGDGQPDSDAALTRLGISIQERQQIASAYAPNASLWRAPTLGSFPYDFNWPGMLLGTEPRGGVERGCDGSPGRKLLCESQNSAIQVGMVGSPFGLHYNSGRAQGNSDGRTVEVQLIGGTVPPDLQGIKLEIEIAGRVFRQSFAPEANLRYTFTWDGKDAYGRELQGSQSATIRIGHEFPVVYNVPAATARSFGLTCTGSVSSTGTQDCIIPSAVDSRARERDTRWQTISVQLGGWDARQHGTGGFTLTPHHIYDPAAKVLYRGDAGRRSAKHIGPESQPLPVGVDGYGEVAVGPDGSLYVTGGFRVVRVAPDGGRTTVAGNGVQCETAYQGGTCGDGGSAVQARLSHVRDLELGPDGTLYILDAHRVWRVGGDGIIRGVAGNGTSGFSGDGGPATQAQIWHAEAIAVAQDGTIYIADTSNDRVRRVGPDGIITTVAGGVRQHVSEWNTPHVNGKLATQVMFYQPRGVAVGPGGELYVTFGVGQGQVRRIGMDGRVTVVAGDLNPWEPYCSPTFPKCEDGRPVLDTRLEMVGDLDVAADGTVYLIAAGRIRRVGADSVVQAAAGNGSKSFFDAPAELRGPATLVPLVPQSFSLAPDGTIYSVHGSRAGLRVHRFGPALSGVGEVWDGSAPGHASDGELTVASRDGVELYVFDGAGRHLRTVSPTTGDTIYHFGYDSRGLLLTVTDRNGQVTRIERDGSGRMTAVVAPHGQRTAAVLDAEGNLTGLTAPDGSPVHFAYAPGGLLASRTDANGNTSGYGYDVQGRLVGRTDAAGSTMTIARSETADGVQVAFQSALGRNAAFSTQHLATGDTRRTARLPGGQSVALSGRPGREVIESPDGTITVVNTTADPRFGMQAPLWDDATSMPSGLVRKRSFGRTVEMSNPLDPLSLIRKTETLTVNGRATTETFEKSTGLITRATPAGRRSTTKLDAEGRPLTQTVAGLAPVFNTYDAEGRITQVTQEGRTQRYTYDAQGFLSATTDALGRTERYTYDAAGRLTGRTLFDGRVVRFGYDANGNLTALTPPSRPEHGFGYTVTNQSERYTAPDAGSGPAVTRLEYNADGQIVQMLRPDGVVVQTSYDAAGRKSGLTLPGWSLGYTYSGTTGQLQGVSTPTGSLAYTYDGSLLTGVTWTGEVGGSLGLKYDNDFRVVAQMLNGTDTVAVRYDPDGLLVGVGALTIARNAENGLVAGTTLGGTSTSQGYNAFGERISLSASYGASVLYQTSYTRDNGGRITTLTEGVGGQTTTYAYTYDDAGRLVQVTRDGEAWASYEYDANGNRTRATGPNGSVVGSYDAQDRLVSYGEATYAYTANGELQIKVIGSDTTRYTYDALGNLREVRLPDGTKVEYLVDGENRRIGKKVNGSLVQGFLHEAALRPVAELDGAGQVVSRFVYGEKPNVPEYMVRSGRTYRIVTDHLGSVRLVVDVESGEIRQRIDYDVFGRVMRNTNPGFQPFGYAGGLHDAHTGLVRFGARDYDAHTGRWTAKDPILFDGGDPNLYGYALQDPVNAFDPAGTFTLVEIMASDVAWDILGEVVGGAPRWTGIGGAYEITSELRSFAKSPEVAWANFTAGKVDEALAFWGEEKSERAIEAFEHVYQVYKEAVADAYQAGLEAALGAYSKVPGREKHEQCKKAWYFDAAEWNDTADGPASGKRGRTLSPLSRYSQVFCQAYE